MKHWYSGKPGCRRSVMQVDYCFRDRNVKDHGKPTIPEEIMKMAAEEYNAQGYRQSHERLQERGGLSAMEVIQLLADRCERLSKGS